ncbi:MAG TPA: murein biosynthesis integral membrane protein MurJ [Acidimicrobiales bacterium]|nr:murein biosynthesis integral membrane protein MurJ [Acidimicrobiales bacterium]
MGGLFDQDEPAPGRRPGPRHGASRLRGGRDDVLDDESLPHRRGPAWPEPSLPDPTGAARALRVARAVGETEGEVPPEQWDDEGDSAPAAPSMARVRRPPARPAPPPAAPDAARPRPGPAPQRAAPPPAAGRRSLATASVVMAGGTLLSRLTGFARVVLVATILGTSGLGDAYNLANSVPNIVYDLLLGGILSATLVPVFVGELTRRDRAEGRRAVDAVVTAIVLGLAVVSVALWALAPLVLRFYLLLNHLRSKAAEQAVGTSLLHLFAPQVLLLGAIVVSTALLNARRHFAAAAYSPVLNNLIAIAALLATRAVASSLAVGPFRAEHGPLLVLGLGTTLGYLVQLVVQVPAMRAAGIRLRPVLDLHHPAVRRVAGLSAWLVGTVVANQVAFNVVLLYAARRGGDVTVYTTAYQFFQLPYALFTVSIASTLTPDLAERWSAGDRLGFARRVIRGLRVTLGILVPAGAGYAVIASPLIALGVRYGHVSAAGAGAIGSSLAWFAAGLPGFSAFALVMRAFQAMQDTRAMFTMYVVENAITLVGVVTLYPAMGVQGLAVAFVAPYTLVAGVAAARLARRVGTLGGALTVRALARIVVASVGMLAVLLALRAGLPAGNGRPVVALRLVVEVVGGAATYTGLARLLGVGEIEPVLGLVGPLVRPLLRRVRQG